MKRSLAVAVVAVSALLSASAEAQTMMSNPWSGFYAGASLGGGFGNNTIQQNYLPSATAFGATPFSTKTNVEGGIVGLGGGYNYAWNSFVLGLEADASITSFEGSKSIATPPTVLGPIPGTSATDRERLDFLATVRPRIGYAVLPQLLGYVTGGLALGNLTYSSNTNFAAAGAFNGSKKEFKAGWTAGGGAEWAINPTWSIKAEYLYVDLGSETVTSQSIRGFSVTDKFDTHENIIRLGLNYHFGVPTPPPAMATPVVAAPPAPPPAVVAPSRQMFIVFFEFDKSALTPDGKKVVDAAAAAFKSGKSDIALAGYTDLAGTQQYNLALSHRRADTVKAALVKDGVPADSIGESWFGKENPRVPTADGVREPQNRRVEITM